MENNIKTIKGCYECPFRYSDYDDWAVGDDTCEICVLAQNMNLPDYFIVCYKRGFDDDIALDTPEWCPIKETFSIKLEKIK
jgi:hypothetical protein